MSEMTPTDAEWRPMMTPERLEAAIQDMAGGEGYADAVEGLAVRMREEVRRGSSVLVTIGHERLARYILGLDAASATITNQAAEIERLREARTEHIAMLAECYRLSGADTDGDEDWRFAPRAVEAVRELRTDYDEACEADDKAMRFMAAERDRLREALRECADDLAAEVGGRYADLPLAELRPDERRRYERDMVPVFRARALLEAP